MIKFSGDKLKKIRVLAAAVIGFGAPAALGATTTLDFDSIPEGQDVNAFYSAQGITAVGATIFNGATLGMPPHSGLNLAIASSGSMTFTVNSAILGNVQTVSAYISDEVPVGIYAYDASGALVGQSFTTGPINSLVSVSSSGNPIASVAVHNGGTTFFVDDLSFESIATVPLCRDQILAINPLLAAVLDQEFRNVSRASKNRRELLSEIKSLLVKWDSGRRKESIFESLVELYYEVGSYIKPTSSRNSLLLQIQKVGSDIRNKKCN